MSTNIHAMWLRSSTLFLLASVFVPASAQVLDKPIAEYPVTLHERLNDSCELVRGGTMVRYKDYVAVRLSDAAEQIYSPELGKNDFLAMPQSLAKNEVKAARKSGFDVRLEPGNRTAVPRVVAIRAGGACPILEDSVHEIAKQRTERDRQLQSHFYAIGGDVTPPVPLKQQQPNGSKE